MQRNGIDSQFTALNRFMLLPSKILEMNDLIKTLL
jgi:hypothetical protein